MDFLDYREKLGIGFCDEGKFKYFRGVIFNILNLLAESTYSGCIDIEEYFAFCDTTGIPSNSTFCRDYHRQNRFEHCLSIIERTRTLNEFLAYYIALTNAIKIKKHSEQEWTRKKFSDLLCDKLTQAHIPFDLFEDNEEYFVFPKGAKELDDALVSEPFEWIKHYANAHKTYCIALKQYADGVYIRDVADNLRKTFEEFLREFLGNNNDLNKNKKEVEIYLKKQNADPQLITMLVSLISHYYLLNNEVAKHNDKMDKKYLEYLLYQTGIFMRMLIVVKTEGSNNAD